MRPSFIDYHIIHFLKKLEKQNKPLDLSLNFYFRRNKSIGAKERRKISDTIYSLIRQQGLLDYLSEKPHTWEKRYKTYQTYHLQNYQHDPTIPPHIRISFPKLLFERLKKAYGEKQAIEIGLICNTRAPLTIRVNLLKTTRQNLFNRLKEKYEVSICQFSSTGLYLKNRLNLFELKEFKEGLFEVQDEGSQIIASLMTIGPNQQVLDYCAGSGGKTLAIAPLMKNSGQIYLHDIRTFPLRQAQKRLKRANIQNAQFLYPNNPKIKKLKKKMDWVLLDVPSSGSGTLRRNPLRKWKIDEAMLRHLKEKQRLIFKEGLDFLKPKGKILYATCSILPEENEEQVNFFLKNYNLELDGIPIPFLPQKNKMDGFFGAIFKYNPLNFR